MVPAEYAAMSKETSSMFDGCMVIDRWFPSMRTRIMPLGENFIIYGMFDLDIPYTVGPGHPWYPEARRYVASQRVEEIADDAAAV